MNRFWLLLIVLISINYLIAIPHPVYVEIENADGETPEAVDVSFSAWRFEYPDDVLTEESCDCYYGAYGNCIKINCGNFISWNPGEILCLDVLQISTGQIGYSEFELQDVNYQYFSLGDGGIILEPFYPLVLYLPLNFQFNEDEELLINLEEHIYAENPGNLSISLTEMNHINIVMDSLLVTIIPEEEWSGTEYCIFTLDDNSGNVISDSVNFIVLPVNDPPEFNIPVSSFIINEDDSLWVDFSGFYSDVDNEELELYCSGNNHIDVQIDGGEVIFYPAENWNGSEEIIFSVTDGITRDITSDTVEVTVNPVNDPPVIELPEGFTFLAGEEEYTADLNDMIWDVDGDELDIAVSGNQQITPVFEDMIVTFEVPAGWHGTETLVFSVNDNQTRVVVTDTVDVMILALSDTYFELPSLEINDGESFSVDITTTMLFEEWSVVTFSMDIEYDPYVITWQDYSMDNSIISQGNLLVEEPVPGQLNISYLHYLPLTGSGNLVTLEFDTFCYGETLLDIQNALVNNETAVISVDGNIVVNDIGLAHPPVAVAGVDQVVDELTEVQLDGTASFDPDGDVITFNWSGSPAIEFDDPTSATPSFTAPDVNEDTEYIINLVCSDGTFNSQPDMLTITVNYVNHAPEIELPETISFPEDSDYTVNFSAYITDIDPDELTLSVTGEVEIVVEIDGFEVTFSAPENWFGSEVMTFTINDNINRLIDTDEIEIIVEVVNDPPQADAGEDQEVQDGTQVTLDASASSDIEGDELTYIWIPPTGIMLDEPYSITPSFTAPQTVDPMDYIFTLQVSDNQTRETNEDEVTITVFDDEPALPQIEILPDNQARFFWLPPGAAGSGDELDQGFEGPVVPQGWTNIDNDGDGYGWYIINENPHSGENCIASASHFNNNALTPDNWLITPGLELGGLSTLHFWVAAEDEYYPNEHYSVRISISGTSPEDFTATLWEETLENNQWHQYSIALTEWAGETAHIAFVHHDCTNQLMIKLDDVQILNSNNRELDGYNVYLDDEFQDFIEEREYIFSNVHGEHTAGVEAVYDDEASERVTVESITPNTNSDLIPEVTSIDKIYPNPFNPETIISFDLAEAGNVNLSVYNIKGQRVTELVNEHQEAGQHNVVWNADGQASGIYFVKMHTANQDQTQKVILMK